MNLGGYFINEMKDEEELKFFVEQQDSKERSALEIMSEHKFYPLLESNEMATIIQEKWHGTNSQNFGLFTASTLYNMWTAGYDPEESKRLFRTTILKKEDYKSYVFQYYLWPDSCSIRYIANSFFIILLAVFY